MLLAAIFCLIMSSTLFIYLFIYLFVFCSCLFIHLFIYLSIYFSSDLFIYLFISLVSYLFSLTGDTTIFATLKPQDAQTLFVIYVRDNIALRFEPFKRMRVNGSKIALKFNL